MNMGILKPLITEGAKATVPLSQRAGKLKELVQPLIEASEITSLNDGGQMKNIFEALSEFKTNLNGQASQEAHEFLNGLVAKIDKAEELTKNELSKVLEIADQVKSLKVVDKNGQYLMFPDEMQEAPTVAEPTTQDQSPTLQDPDKQAGEIVDNLIALFTGRVSLPNSFLNNGLKIAQKLGIKGIPEPHDLTKWVTEKVVGKSGFKKAVVNFISGGDLGKVTIDNENDGFVLGFIKNRALGFMKKALVTIKETDPEKLSDGLSRSAFLFNSFGLGPAMSMISTLPMPRFLRTAIAWALPAVSRTIESLGEQDQQDRIKALYKMLNPNTATADAVQPAAEAASR